MSPFSTSSGDTGPRTTSAAGTDGRNGVWVTVPRDLIIFLIALALGVGFVLLILGAIVIMTGALIWVLAWGMRRLAYYRGTRTGTLLARTTVLYFVALGGIYGMTLYPPALAYALPALVWSTLGFAGAFLYLDFTSDQRDAIPARGQWEVMSPPRIRGLIGTHSPGQAPPLLCLPNPDKAKRRFRRFFR